MMPTATRTSIGRDASAPDAGYAHWYRRGEIDTSHGQILYLEDVHVSFDGFKAIKGLNLMLAENELRCVIGPNGAGKTTMMDVITGKTRPDRGTVYLGQTLDLARLDEAGIAQAGIGRKFQKPTVFENHTVWQNLDLARATDKRWFRALAAAPDAAARARIDEILQRTVLAGVAGRLAGELSHGQKQRLEIGMLLMQQPRLLLLDEPAAGISDEETRQLAQLLESLRGTCSMLVVEHDMTFVAALAGQTGIVTVLADGSVLAEGTLAAVQRDERVIESYLGR